MNQPPHLQLFTYEGPATIGGLAFDDVSLHEEPDPFSQHPTPRWKGTAAVPFAAWPPPHFGLPDTPTLEIVLADGRRSQLCAGCGSPTQRYGSGGCPLCVVCLAKLESGRAR